MKKKTKKTNLNEALITVNIYYLDKTETDGRICRMRDRLPHFCSAGGVTVLYNRETAYIRIMNIDPFRACDLLVDIHTNVKSINE